MGMLAGRIFYLKDMWARDVAALTFASFMALIPFMAMMFVIARGFGYASLLESLLSTTFEAQPVVAQTIVNFVHNYIVGKERIFDDLNNGFGWDRLPKSFMAENTVFLLLTALVRNFYKFIMERLEEKKFGLKATSRIKAFVFKFITVPAKWIRTSRQFILNIYTDNQAYGELFNTDFG